MSSAQAKILNDLLSKYTQEFPAHSPGPTPSSTPSASEDVVLLTGSTGNLGSALLEYMVARPCFVRIYAFNRKDRHGRDIKQRQSEALIERGFDSSIVNSPKIIFVEGDTARPDLGIEKDLYEEVCILFLI